MRKGWIAIAAAIAVVVVVLGFGAWWTYGLNRDQEPMNGAMDGMAAPDDVPRFPPVAAYYDGERVFFAHTETSDPEIAELLTGMMAGSPVITVPELADIPEAARGPVYVFTNGVQPEDARGPLGYQPDVFDTAPGDPGYTPLRQLVLLTWSGDAEPRLLISSDEIDQAVDAGELSAERSDAVINMPLLTWPAGHR